METEVFQRIKNEVLSWKQRCFRESRTRSFHGNRGVSEDQERGPFIETEVFQRIKNEVLSLKQRCFRGSRTRSFH